MSAPPIRIRIGASVDASVDTAFKTIESRARKAQAALNAAQARSAGNLNKDVEAAIYRQAQAFDAVAAAAKRAANATTDGARRTRGGVEQATDEVLRSNRARESFARRTSHRTTRFAIAGARMTRDALGGAVRGMGVDTSIASVFSNITEQERLAAGISNKAYVKGDKLRGTRIDPSVLVQETRENAKRLGGGTLAGMEAMNAFVNQRGNLSGWRALAPDLLKRAISQGGDPAEIGLTAAKIDSALSSQGEYATDDTKRNKAILRVLDNLIVQGKVGSIDFDNMSNQIPKLAGLASMYSGDPGDAISALMTVAQLAEQGTAPNAALATTFTANLSQDMVKRSRHFEEAGIKVYEKDRNGMTSIRPILDVLVDTIAATAEDKTIKKRGQPAREMNQIEQLYNLLPNKRAVQGAQEFYSIYKGAGGGERGKAALKARLDEFGGSGTNQIEADFAQIQNTTANKAERFNANMEDAAERLKDRLVPALSNASDSIVSFAGMLADVAAYAVENPFKTLLMGMSASFAAAASESFVRVGVENLVNATRPGATTTGGMGALGAAASVLTIAALAVTTLTVGTAIIDAFFANKEKEDKTQAEHEVATAGLDNEVRARARKGDYSGAAETLEKKIARQEYEIQERQAQLPGVGDKVMSLLADAATPGAWKGETPNLDNAGAREQMLKEEIAKQQAELAASRAALQRLVELTEAQERFATEPQ